MKKIQAETLTGTTELTKNQPVYIKTSIPGKVFKGIVLTPSKKISLIRYNEDGILMEKKIDNKRLIPVIPPNSKLRKAEEITVQTA
jgi:hypothetical protein